ncbi:disease resistance protein RUN1 [Lactuca sativa]|uniref:disease resistance protein RUN1 n=1 Tax=Lactuca sativa TaxID=4236 RepID=UPI000CD9C702|nr:disease resistance protein RUN1 [Lactuca sativa]
MSYNPKEGYEKVSETIVNYCQGNPMALKVLGKSLHDQNVAYWKGRIQGLMKEKDYPLNNVLRMSFKSLPYDDDRELFKHIACFFVGMDRYVTETIVNACGINTDIAFKDLIDRCLISIGWNNELVMHQLLQKMGRFEVREESPKKPWKQSRLWCHEESLEVLKEKKAKEKVIGLALDMKMLEQQKFRETFVLKTDALSKMHKMKLLQLNYVQINGSYEDFPGQLRWLCMHGFPSNSIPQDLNMENLVALDMSYSKIKSFGICNSNQQQFESTQKLTESSSKDKTLLRSLKILKLNFCKELQCLGSFDELPSLERLIATNCTSLLEVCESIKTCIELVLIDLRYCEKLEKLPTAIDMLKKVKTLLLDGCSLSGSRIETGNMDSLEMLKANNTDINTITSSSTIPEATPIPINLDFTAISIPKSLVKLSLANNNLSTESFPIDFSWLSKLEELYLDDNPIISLPNCVRSLPVLKKLGISNCKRLMSIEHLPHTLRELTLYSIYKPSLRKVVFLPEMSPLRLLIEWKSFAPSSFEFEGMIKVQPIVAVEEKLLSSLGWTKLDFLNKQCIETPNLNRESGKSEIQMYHQFGIFSTIYGAEDMPSWITDISQGQSISFTIPSSSKNLTGLNFCCVQHMFLFQEDDFFYLPMMIITNKTKSYTWMYQHYIDKVSVGGEFLVLLSHWMFGKNEMEDGDEVTVTVTEEPGQTRVECGVSFVYDNGKTDEEEENVLGYYKSWNHIIGGDLSPFETTKGEYILNTRRFMMHADEVNYDHQFVGEDSSFKERNVWFRALSQRKSHSHILD